MTPESFADEAAAHRWYLDEHDPIAATVELALRHGWTRAAANITMDLRRSAQRISSPRQRTQELSELLAAAGGLDSDDAFGDPALLGDVLRVLAFNQKWYGTADQAEEFLRRAQRLLAPSGDRLVMAQLLRGVGRLNYDRRDYEAALSAFEQALEQADGEDGAVIRARVQINIGNTHFRRNDWQSAYDAYDRAAKTEMERRTGGVVLIVANLNRAENLLKLGRDHEALEAVEACRAAGGDSHAYKAVLFTVQARAALRTGDFALARWSVVEFRRFVAETGAEKSEVTWESGIEGLLADIAEIERALDE